MDTNQVTLITNLLIRISIIFYLFGKIVKSGTERYCYSSAYTKVYIALAICG